jgi:hypothetical protein
LQIDLDLVRALDDMIVGHDIAIGGNDETRPQRALFTGHATSLLAKKAFELFKKIPEWILPMRIWGKSRCMFCCFLTILTVLMLTTARPDEAAKSVKSGRSADMATGP